MESALSYAPYASSAINVRSVVNSPGPKLCFMPVTAYTLSTVVPVPKSIKNCWPKFTTGQPYIFKLTSTGETLKGRPAARVWPGVLELEVPDLSM